MSPGARCARFAFLGVCCMAAGRPAPAQEGLQRAWELVGEGRFAAALEAARLEPDPLARDQALVLVLHHAGDLQGALHAGLEGLERFPEDAWLLDQSAYVAVSLREAGLANELCLRLARAAGSDTLAGPEAERYRARATALAPEALLLASAARGRDRAIDSARVTVAGVLGLALLALGWLTLAPLRPNGERLG